MYESRAYDKPGDAFGPEPVVVLVVTGTHDVSRLVNLFAGGQPVVEQLQVGKRIREQVKRHNGGQAALKLLRDHGGPDFTDEQKTEHEQLHAAVHDISNARHIYVQRSVDRFVDRNHGNVSEDEITKRYQQGVDRWNEDHPALLALWRRYNALVEAAKAGA